MGKEHVFDRRVIIGGVVKEIAEFIDLTLIPSGSYRDARHLDKIGMLGEGNERLREYGTAIAHDVFKTAVIFGMTAASYYQLTH